MLAAAALEVACDTMLTCCCGLPRVDGAAVQATEEALAEVVRQRMEVRRLHNSVRARYHKLMQTASAAEIALFHSHNDGIRFIAWIFASIKVSPEPRACAAGSDHIEALLLAVSWICPARNSGLCCVACTKTVEPSEPTQRLQFSCGIGGGWQRWAGPTSIASVDAAGSDECVNRRLS